METAELEVFDRGLRHATATRSGKDLDAALGDLGWSEALAADRRAAVSLLFEHQGKANTTSGALDRVLVAGLGLLDTGETYLSTNPGTLIEVEGSPWGTITNSPAVLNVLAGLVVPVGSLVTGLPEV